MTLAENICHLRERAGISQEAAARAANVSMNTWSRWERGVTPGADRIPAIAAALGSTPKELFDRVE